MGQLYSYIVAHCVLASLYRVLPPKFSSSDCDIHAFVVLGVADCNTAMMSQVWRDNAFLLLESRAEYPKIQGTFSSPLG
jgi:hypothetical protein